MYWVTFRNLTGRVESHKVATRSAVIKLAFAADQAADRAVNELRVRTPSADRFGPIWEDVTDQF